MQKHVFAFHGRRIELWTHPEPDHLAVTIRASRSFYELDVLMKCREIYLPGTAVIDIGANIGNHAVFFAAVLGAPVHALEPYGPSHELLEINIAANGLDGRVVPYRLAAGDTAGAASPRPGPPGNLGATRMAFGEGDVSVRRLDTLDLRGPVGLLKVDVEGAEPAVLRGAERLIRTWLPDVMVEAGEPEAFQAVARVLLGFGYTPRGRYAATPTYLFSAVDQPKRLRRLLG
jgi:FkbM family methyltransferase